MAVKQYGWAMALIAAQVAVVVLVVLEVNAFRRGRTVIDMPQFIWRMVGAFLLLVLLMMMFGGLLLRFQSKVREVYFWSACTVLAGLIVIIALLDARTVLRRRVKQEGELYKDLIGKTLMMLPSQKERDDEPKSP